VNDSTVPPIKISVVVLNYNGMAWLPRCYESLEKQTIFKELEIILTDNNSTDESVKFVEEWHARTRARGCVVQNGANLLHCAASNNGAAVGSGEFFLFLNNDSWLEPDCLEILYNETVKAGADCGAPLVLDYDVDNYQAGNVTGLDFCGMVTESAKATGIMETFNSPGNSILVRAELFRKIGGYGPELLIYTDETDLCFRVWIGGGRIVTVPASRSHHRGAPSTNPAGYTKMVEARTSETKRYLANRNGILLVAKNSQHLLLLLLIPHLLVLLAEAVAALILVRRWSYVQRSYLAAVVDTWRMRRYIMACRRRIRGFRKRSDFWMLRFLRLKPNRMWELEKVLKMGVPKVDAK
jgi:hypothetical protein